MSHRMKVRDDCGRVVVEEIKPRASAARSGMNMESVGRRWSKTVGHACAQCETSYVWPTKSGTRCRRKYKVARKCSKVWNKHGVRLVAGGQKQSGTRAHDVKLHKCSQLGQERVVVEDIKPRASAARSGMKIESVGCRWSKMVRHACAQCETP
ncbi:hypothetical protein EDB84DRAFT_171641 [Lactarius hengduanensis]|nr:hypothetical protein EDB84DRAFT_171641 [Lactarius hengduanensis]